jgi:6-phosphogluconolactonase (cycloisomerase 2 family)
MKSLSRALSRARVLFGVASLFFAANLRADVALYVPVEGGSPGIHEYAVNSFSGGLTPVTSQPVDGNGANSIAVTPNNKFLFVGTGDGPINAFLVNFDGTLTGAGFLNAGNVRGLATDAAGAFLYASNYNGSQIQVFSINQTTGALTALPALTVSLSGKPLGMVTDGAGHLYVALDLLPSAGQVGQFTINPSTGALTAIAAPIAAEITPDRLALTPNGAFLYAANYFSGTISAYAIGGGGALTAVGSPVSVGNVAWRPQGIAVSNTGSHLVVTLNFSGITNNVQVYSIAGNGGLTAVGSAVAAGSQASGVTFDPTGRFVYVSNNGSNNITKFVFTAGALGNAENFATGAGPRFLLARPVPLAPGVPALSTWALAGLALLLMGSSAFLYRRAYR